MFDILVLHYNELTETWGDTLFVTVVGCRTKPAHLPTPLWPVWVEQGFGLQDLNPGSGTL